MVVKDLPSGPSLPCIDPENVLIFSEETYVIKKKKGRF